MNDVPFRRRPPPGVLDMCCCCRDVVSLFTSCHAFVRGVFFTLGKGELLRAPAWELPARSSFDAVDVGSLVVVE
jgi:hypothetical protein